MLQMHDGVSLQPWENNSILRVFEVNCWTFAAARIVPLLALPGLEANLTAPQVMGDDGAIWVHRHRYLEVGEIFQLLADRLWRDAWRLGWDFFGVEYVQNVAYYGWVSPHCLTLALT